MSGLTQKDIDILGQYARGNNRELYWNYLAQKPGNDGYGLLALGVVRNDSAPGATANAFASDIAAREGVHLTERQWDAVGRDLIKQDFVRRQSHFEKGEVALALNLPAKAIQDAHDAAFAKHGIPVNAWTPRELLENARKNAGEPESERIWDVMLDNHWRGLTRLVSTADDVRRHADSPASAMSYLGRMADARAEALHAVPTTHPDRIRMDAMDYRRDAQGGWWRESGIRDAHERHEAQPERDPRRLAELEDTRALRLEQAALRTQFHPDDPNRHRPLLRSPALLADDGAGIRAPLASAPLVQEAAHRPGVGAGTSPSPATTHASFDPTDPRDPLHPRHGLWASTEAAVHRLDASLGRTPDAASERMTASLFAAAVQRGMTRVDHAVLSVATADRAAGHMVFAVQGALDDPAKLRAQMPTAEALGASVDDSLRRAHAIDVPTFAHSQDTPMHALNPDAPVLRRA